MKEVRVSSETRWPLHVSAFGLSTNLLSKTVAGFLAYLKSASHYFL